MVFHFFHSSKFNSQNFNQATNLFSKDFSLFKRWFILFHFYLTLSCLRDLFYSLEVGLIYQVYNLCFFLRITTVKIYYLQAKLLFLPKLIVEP